MGKSPSQAPTAAFLIIGNEILSGRTQDKNLSFLAKTLNQVGIDLCEVRVVADQETQIIGAVQALQELYTYVFTSGGIGPTHDDITTACIAKAFGRNLIRHSQAQALLEMHYNDKPADLNEARLKMADIPEGAALIDNPVSKAPGFILNGVYVMAGVPRIFQAMIEGLLPGLQGDIPSQSVSVSASIREGDAAAPLADLQEAFPDLDLGSYPYHRNGTFGTTLVARGRNPDNLRAIRPLLVQLVEDLGGKAFDERPEGDDAYAAR